MASITNITSIPPPIAGHRIVRTEEERNQTDAVSPAQTKTSPAAAPPHPTGSGGAASSSQSSTTIVSEISTINPDGSVTTTSTYADGSIRTTTGEPDPAKSSAVFRERQKLSGVNLPVTRSGIRANRVAFGTADGGINN